MSVKVEHLTKIYGVQKAVNDISFEAPKGQILGFLGPNGAGKSTTMKVITCYIPPSSGHVKVSGHDVSEEAMEVRKKIGYLPEQNPLYKDMYVKEYLEFVAGVHKISNKQQRIREMIGQTGLDREQHKKIGALSKGYRQRVGLAQALIHDPEVLILDEPTSGLDPNQLVEIRSLIKNLGKEKTVIFSTHIMQEVQALCDRVIIINKGKIVADDPIGQLQNRVNASIRIKAEFIEKVAEKLFLQIPGVIGVDTTGKSSYVISTNGKNDLRPEIFLMAKNNNLTLLEMYQEKSSVEDVFQLLTKGS
ncbi:MAG: gliding motility-associated ABC transporter ATP-binding subunit GldA [Saprospiraceae bacterium]